MSQGSEKLKTQILKPKSETIKNQNCPKSKYKTNLNPKFRNPKLQIQILWVDFGVSTYLGSLCRMPAQNGIIFGSF
jgi:hypothetical protein